MRYLALLLVGLTVAFPAAAQPCHDASPASHAESGADEAAGTDIVTGKIADATAPAAGLHPCGAPPDTVCACCIGGAVAPATTTAERGPTAAIIGTDRREDIATRGRVSATPVRGPPRAAPLDAQGPRGPPTPDTPRA
jgi:hypothetical protein